VTVLLRRGHHDILRDPLDPDPFPAVWTGGHVALRITEGFQTLKLLPMGRLFDSSLVSSWPAYAPEFQDLLNQTETAELERTMREQNKARISPSMRDVSAAIEATSWPARYLSRHHPELCVATNAVALAHALDRPAEWVVRKRGGFADTWRARHDQGCDRIASGLIRSLG
jgi:hypothetical protein